MARRPIAEHTTAQLQNVIDNHCKLSKAADPYCLEALEELARRKGQGLDFQKSFNLIRQAAAERRFLSYKEVADGSGVKWSTVRYAMNRHLDDLLEYVHLKGWPLLTAIVVNKDHVKTGDMEEYSLRGLANAARKLGYAVVDDLAFVRDQQERVFEWAGRPLKQA